jgi:glycosyltransferase involved in cell wall biosynthesis
MCRLEEEGLREADLIVAVSSAHAQSLIHRYSVDHEKIRVVRNAVRGAASNEETDPVSRGRRWKRTGSGPLVLFLGRITEQKGAMDFLRVAAKVSREIRGVRFVMAGEGDETPRVLEAARRLGLQGCLSMTGFLDREGVAKLLCSTDVLLFPSLSDPFGISPLEAMSYGVPVVLTRQSGVSETVRNVIKCEAGDIDAMASAVAQLISDPERRMSLGERAAQEANRPGWARAALEIAAAYHELDVLTKRKERHT